MSGFSEKAQLAWGDALPEWVARLAQACDRANQSSTAKRLNISPAYVSWVLSNENAKYHPSVEEAVRATLMKEEVDCPVLGDATLIACRSLRRGMESGGTSQLQRLARPLCPTCVHNISKHKGSRT